MLVLSLAWLVSLVWIVRRKGLEAEWDEKKWRLTTFFLLVSTILVYLSYLLPLEGFFNAFPIDDSYITLTAARNIAEHNLFAVNPNYPLAGITSPLHAGLVGMLGKLIAVETASRVIGLLFFLLLVVGVFIWARQLGGSLPFAAMAGAIVTLSGPMAFSSLNGLETAQFAALLIWTFVAFELARERVGFLYLMGALTGLAILTRPEGWFLAAVVFTVMGLRCLIWQRQRLLHVVLAGLLALAVVAPYLIANTMYHDALFPITVSAKKYFFSDGCRPLWKKFIIVLMTSWLALGPFTLAVPLLGWSKNFLKRVYPLLFVVLFYGAYLTQFPGALGHYWGRYQHPLMPFLIVGIVLGFERLMNKLQRSEAWLRRLVGISLAVFLFLATAVGGKMEQQIYRNALGNSQMFLMTITDWIRNHSEPGDVIATHDVGALYYFGERPVLDLVGLADPEVAEMYRNEPDLCAGKLTRRLALYKLVRDRAPKIVYFCPNWDDWFLGLTRTDRGLHMRQAYNYKHEYQLDSENEVTIYEYDFYICDWTRDLRKQQP